MMRRMFLVALGLSAVALVTALHAQDGSQPSPQPALPDLSKTKDKITLEEKKLAEKFNVFMQQLTQLKDKLEKGTVEDRNIAKILHQVIERSKSKSIDVQFQELVEFLNTDNLKNFGSISDALAKSEKLTNELQELLVLLRQEKSLEDLQAERLKMEKLILELQKLITTEKFIQAKTQIFDPADSKNLEAAQKENADKTKEVAQQVDGKGDGDKGGGGEGEIAKSSAKSADKGEGQKADGKGEAKPGDSKGEGQGKKGGEGQEGSQGQAKGGEGQDGDKPGAGEKGQPGQGKDGGKDGMKDGQGGAKGGEDQKPGEGEPGGAKGGDGKEPGEGQPGGAKGGDGKEPGEGQPSGAKGGGEAGGDKGSEAGGAKGGEGGAKGGEGGAKDDGKKEGEPKQPSEDKGNDKAEAKKASKGDQGQAKAGEKGDQGGAKAGMPKGGDDDKGGEGGSKGGAKSGGQPGEPGGSGGGGGGDDGDDQQAQIKKQIQDAEHYQRIAEKEIAKKAPDKAVPEQEKAIDSLNKAKKQLEDILRQLREEEIERLLAALQVRCEHMLIMQIAVRDATVSIGESIAKNNNKKTELHKKQALDQSNQEKEIIEEANKAIEMLEAEGSAVAFPEVFKQVREDMKIVAYRLEDADVGTVTVAIENDIIQTLEEMVAALKKARDDNKKKKDSKGGEGGGKPGDQKLMELIAELKMIRSMQLKVNNRTNLYGQQYQGEQANNPEIQKQLHELGDRQEKLFDVTNRLAKGDNK